MSEVTIRLGVDGIILVAALFGPWWLVMAAGVVLVFVMPYFVEFIGVAFLMDVLYAAHALSIPLPWLGAAATVIVVLSIVLRRVLRFYKSDPAVLV